jgi:hypothetical protein
MDSSLIYVKTPAGNEAVRQGAQVVQRNMRLVLLQIDGRLSVRQLVAKIGNQRLVEGALRELEEGGFIETTSVFPQSGAGQPASVGTGNSVISQFSSFGPSSIASAGGDDSIASSGFSIFGLSTASLPASDVSLEPSSLPPLASIRAARPKRRIAVGRWLLGGIVGVVAALLAAALFYPYDNFRPDLEAALSRQLAAPVRIGAVHLGWLPQPRLLIDGVTVGSDGEWRIATLAINSPWLLLGGAGRSLPEIEAGGVRLTANQLVDIPFFGGRGVADGSHPLRRLRITDATVTLGDLTSDKWRGEILFGDDGGTEKASFRRVDGNLHLEATPAAQGVALVIESPDWKPESLPFGFEAIQASGFLQKNRLSLEKIDTNFLGGQLKGNWQLDWSASDMAMVGEESLTRLDSRQVTAALAPSLRLEGELGGALRLRASGRGWQDMMTRIEASLDVRVARGQLLGTDLGELARNGSGGVVRSGTTHFETLQAHLDMTPGRVTARTIELNAGLMTASGRASIGAGGQIEGNVTVLTRSSVLSTRVPAKVSGTLNNMVLTASN